MTFFDCLGGCAGGQAPREGHNLADPRAERSLVVWGLAKRAGLDGGFLGGALESTLAGGFCSAPPKSSGRFLTLVVWDLGDGVGFSRGPLGLQVRSFGGPRGPGGRVVAHTRRPECFFPTLSFWAGGLGELTH